MDSDDGNDYMAVGPNGDIILYRNHGYNMVSGEWILENLGQITT